LAVLVVLSRILQIILCIRSLSKYCSCVVAAHRMIFSFNLSVYLYQLVVTYVICWLPVDNQYHNEVDIMYNQLKGVQTSKLFVKKMSYIHLLRLLWF
jgi:hypothetical protein